MRVRLVFRYRVVIFDEIGPRSDDLMAVVVFFPVAFVSSVAG